MRKAFGVALAVIVGLVAGCRAQDEPGDATVTINLSEWHLDLSTTSVERGPSDLQIVNSGLLLHELLVVRVEGEDTRLPTAGRVVDIAAVGDRLVGEVTELSPGDDVRVTLGLEPGRYILFCNITGHYELGMNELLEVSDT